jgi:hypothetical protein
MHSAVKIAGLALLSLAAACQTQPPRVAGTMSADPLEGAYGNTVTSTGPEGTYVYYFNRDHTFRIRNPNGQLITGTLVWKDMNTACFTVTDPPPPKGETGINCRPFPVSHQVGDTWIEKDSKGVPYTNTIIAGRRFQPH